MMHGVEEVKRETGGRFVPVQCYLAPLSFFKCLPCIDLLAPIHKGLTAQQGWAQLEYALIRERTDMFSIYRDIIRSGKLGLILSGCS